MKRIIYLLLASVVLIGTQSCKSNKNVAQEEKKPAISGANVASPPVIVYKTKNLYSAIIAHLLFNLAAFILFLFAEAMDLQALIL